MPVIQREWTSAGTYTGGSRGQVSFLKHKTPVLKKLCPVSGEELGAGLGPP